MAQNRPIPAGNVTRRLDMSELIYQNCWAFMRELRTHNRTKKVYDVDPYAEVYQFRDNMYGIFAENINGGGDAWVYLIVGPERAMLIDTGCGLGDLRGLVETILEGRPYIVVNTHPHSDHAGANSLFDRVYILEDDLPMLLALKNNPNPFARTFNEDGSCRMVEFDRADLVQPADYEIVPIQDGHIFNLGDDYEVETIQLAGHTRGQAAFLDRKGRTLFVGDDLIGMRVSLRAEPGTVADFRDRMAKLAARSDEFDGVFPGHFIVDLESSSVQSMVDTLDAILRDPEDYDYTEQRGEQVTLCKAVHGLGCIGYRPESL